jgi:hypothetical protein
VGLLLRVYHEAMLESRGSATVRQRKSAAAQPRQGDLLSETFE